ARGRLVFQKHCASCHRIGNLGVDVAPDIADSRTRKPAQLLTDILQPNRAIDSNYVSYNALTVDGRIITGVLSAETSSSVTMRLPEGRVEVLSRVDIEELKSTGVSLMPVGLEKNINYEQMADLIAFIKNWRYLDGRTPLSE
ncbi:MAG: c-type cytochrome, partial [Pirellulaceae bacterium]|nr:c-type cytochrome [Pirellulaceae bacterium]